MHARVHMICAEEVSVPKSELIILVFVLYAAQNDL